MSEITQSGHESQSAPQAAPVSNGNTNNVVTNGATTAKDGSINDQPTTEGDTAAIKTNTTVADMSKATNGASSITSSKDNSMPAPSLPASATRGRGGSVRARGKSRSSTSKTKKRKREGGEEDDDSDDSEVYAPTNVMTKSGRAVQRPTSFVPPPAIASPGTAPSVKKKRVVWKRNPENAVCKLCQRGVSPASNMIVFCDGCNTPYHRWCHHPPIDQKVIEESDKEWYCRQCRRERIVPVAEADIAHFVAAPGSTPMDRQKFFTSLTPGALVTLLTRMTTLHPQLPVFDADFARKHSTLAAAAMAGEMPPPPIPKNGAPRTTSTEVHETIYAVHDDEDDDEDIGYGPDEHPAHYVRPGKGLMSTLPPDKDDEAILIDDDNSKGVFHHLYMVDEKAATDSVVHKK